MTETVNLVKSKMAQEDIHWGDSTSTFTVTIQGTGYTRHPVDTAVITMSSAGRTALGLSAGADLDDALSALSSGTGLAKAGTPTLGITSLSTAPALPTLPIAVGDNDSRMNRIPSSDEDAAMSAVANALSSSNPFWTTTDDQLQRILYLGSGRDGHGQLGAIAASSTAPVIASSSASGLLTGTFTWKIAAYNLSGEIVASSASSSSGALTTKQVTLTLPALPSAAMGWRIYRSTDGVNWYLVGVSVGSSTSYTDNYPNPNTSVSAPGSDTTGNSATLSGEFHFTDFTFPAGKTITVANSGNTAGVLIIRFTGTYTPGGTINNNGSHRVLLSRSRMGTINAGGGVGTVLALRNATAFDTTQTGQSGLTATNGIGANWFDALMLLQGFGCRGSTSGGTGGDGGYAGGLTMIVGKTVSSAVLTGTFTANGGAGSAGTLGGGNYAEGGGGGAGGTNVFAFVDPWKFTGTANANGGAGGAAAGNVGGNTIYGGGGGGGGFNIFLGPYGVDTSGGTVTATAGANGATATSGTAGTGGNGGGAHAGQSGLTSQSPAAGQTINLATSYAPKGFGLTV